MAHDALQNVDALFQGGRVPLPSNFIFDHLYRIAAYKAWRSERDDGFNQIRAYRIEHYAQILPPLLPYHATVQQRGVIWTKPWTNSIGF